MVKEPQIITSYPKTKISLYPDLATIFPGLGLLDLLEAHSFLSLDNLKLHWVFPDSWSECYPSIKKGEYTKRITFYPLILDQSTALPALVSDFPAMVFTAKDSERYKSSSSSIMGTIKMDDRERIGMYLHLTGSSLYWWKKLFGDAMEIFVMPGRTIDEDEKLLDLLACWICR